MERAIKEKLVEKVPDQHVINVSGHNVTLVFKKEKSDAITQVKQMLSSAYANSLFVTR